MSLCTNATFVESQNYVGSWVLKFVRLVLSMLVPLDQTHPNHSPKKSTKQTPVTVAHPLYCIVFMLSALSTCVLCWVKVRNCGGVWHYVLSLWVRLCICGKSWGSVWDATIQLEPCEMYAIHIWHLNITWNETWNMKFHVNEILHENHKAVKANGGQT